MSYFWGSDVHLTLLNPRASAAFIILDFSKNNMVLILDVQDLLHRTAWVGCLSKRRVLLRVASSSQNSFISKLMFYNLLRDDALRLDSGLETRLGRIHLPESRQRDSFTYDLAGKFIISYNHVSRASFSMIRFYVKWVKTKV
jgi:hypothetical protein